MQTINLKFHKLDRLPKSNRLKFTLILLALLFIGVAAKADVPCHVAIQAQHDSITKLEQQLKTAQSVPYNQGYQAGYEAAQTTTDNFMIVITCICGIIYICLTLYFYLTHLKK